MPDNTLSTLDRIRIKIRRLTRSPSSSQITDEQIDEYVNAFTLYDFPEELRTNYLRKTFTFYTSPYIDVYENSTTPGDDFYNFKNEYTSLHGPVYVAGYQAFFSQSRQQFFDYWPREVEIKQVATGDGVTTTFNGTLSSTPVLRGNVLFSSIDTANNALEAHDDGGSLVGTVTAPGTIDYVTGAYSFDFTSAPKAGQDINAQVVSYEAARPTSVLFYENKLTLRPVPDQPYKVDIEAYVRPTELLNSSDMPDISQWWQYIALGAAKKIFEDRMDTESIQAIIPELKNQETLVLRRTIMQLSNERVSTIYDGQTDLANKIGNI